MLNKLTGYGSCLKVQDLRLWCLLRLIKTLDASSVLQRVSAADLVHDQQLMDACMDFWANSDDRYMQ